MSSVDWTWYPTQVNYVFKSPRGPVGDHLRDVGRRIEIAAKIQVGKVTGGLASTIYSRVYANSRGVATLEVGADHPNALMHHDGTKPHLITPNNVRAMRFPGRTGVVYAKAVMHPGTAPNRFLSDNLGLVRT